MNRRNVALMTTIASLAVVLALLVVLVTTSLPPEPEEDLPEVEYLTVAIDSQDNIHITREDGRDEEIFVFDNWYLTTRVYYSKFDSSGNLLIDSISISDGGGRYPSMGIDSEDNVWVSYLMNGTFLLELDIEGRTILEKRVLDQYETPVAVTVGSDDNIYLSWNECWQLQCFRYYMTLNAAAEVLQGRTNASQSTPIVGYPIVRDQNGQYLYLDYNGGADSSNSVHIIWRSQDDGLHYTKIDENGNITINNTQIALGITWTSLSQVEVDSLDNLHVVAGTSGGLGHLKLDNMGSVLSVVTDIRSEDMIGGPSSPELSSSSSGGAYIVWHVAEMTQPYPNSGKEVYSYYSYCAKIDASGSLVGTWLVAKSKAQNVSPVNTITMLGLMMVVLVSLIVCVIFLRRDKSKRTGRSNHVEDPHS